MCFTSVIGLNCFFYSWFEIIQTEAIKKSTQIFFLYPQVLLSIKMGSNCCCWKHLLNGSVSSLKQRTTNPLILPSYCLPRCLFSPKWFFPRLCVSIYNTFLQGTVTCFRFMREKDLISQAFILMFICGTEAADIWMICWQLQYRNAPSRQPHDVNRLK